MNQKKYFKQKRKEIVKVASAMISGQIDLITGCRMLSKLRFEVESENSDIFNIFRAVDSETDHIPLGKAREKCDKDSLFKIDKEVEEYILSINDEIISSCIKLIEKYS